MKKAALNIMKASGVFAPFRLANRSKALVVMYHRFNTNYDPAAIPAAVFDKQLEYLKSHYKVVPLSFVAERLASREALPRGLAVITIDDGYRDVYEIALPLLRKHNLPATFFVATGFIDLQSWVWTDKLRYIASRAQSSAVEMTVGEHEFSIPLDGKLSRFSAAAQLNEQLKQLPDELKEEMIEAIALRSGVEVPKEPPPQFAPITWEQAREMDSAGVELGSHTVTHPILPNVGRERVRRELAESRARLEEVLGRSVRLFCYPNGDMNDEVKSEVERAGYISAVATEYGFNDERSDLFALRRIPAPADLARFAQSTSGFEQFRMKLIRAGLMAAGASSSVIQAHQ